MMSEILNGVQWGVLAAVVTICAFLAFSTWYRYSDERLESLLMRAIAKKPDTAVAIRSWTVASGYYVVRVAVTAVDGTGETLETQQIPIATIQL